MKFARGGFVRIYFDDHAIDSTPKMDLRCWAMGEVFSFTKKKIVLRHWCSVDGDTNNDEYLTILRSTITAIDYLIPLKGKK